MNAKDLIIAIKTTFDGKGSAEAQKQLDATGKKAEQAAGKQGGAFQTLRKRVSAATESVSAIKNLLMGFGAIGAIGAVIGQFKAIVDDAKKAAEEINKLQDEIGALDSGKAVNRYAKAVRDAAEATADARRETEAWAQVVDRVTAANRKAEDAASRLAETREKAALSPSDPIRAEREAEISARYEHQRALTAGQRSVQDADLAFKRQQAKVLALKQDEELASDAAAAAAAQASGLRAQAELVRSDGRNATKRAPWYKGGWFGRREHDLEAERDAAEKARGLRDQATALDAESTRHGKDAGTAALGAYLAGQLLNALKTEMAAAVSEGQASAITTSGSAASASSAVSAAQVRERLAAATAKARSLDAAYDTRAGVLRAQADVVDPQRRDYGSRDSFMRAKNEDRRLENAAVGAEKQSAALDKLLKQLERTPPEKIAAVLGGIESQLRAFETAIKNNESRSRRQ